ncbi:hypothetical protein D9M69_384720 [compost metagenome]
MALPPRSTSRATPPVRRPRWNFRLNPCRCWNTFKVICREARAITRANTTWRSSVNRVTPMREAP